MMEKNANPFKRAAYYLGYPFYGYLNSRFRDVLGWCRRIDQREQALRSEVEALRGQIDELNALIAEFKHDVLMDTRTISEFVSHEHARTPD